MNHKLKAFFHILNNWPRISKTVPRNQVETKIVKIRGIIERIPNYQKLQSRNERVRIRIRIGTNAQTHRLSLRDEDALVIRRLAVRVIRGGIHDAPESPVHHLIEHRRRALAGVDSSVEVGGSD